MFRDQVVVAVQDDLICAAAKSLGKAERTRRRRRRQWSLSSIIWINIQSAAALHAAVGRVLQKKNQSSMIVFCQEVVVSSVL